MRAFECIVAKNNLGTFKTIIKTTRGGYRRQETGARTVCCVIDYLSEESLIRRAINSENEKANHVKNQLTGDYGAVPDTARYYKVEIVTYGVIFNMSRVWVRGKILVPDMNRTHDLPYTGRVLLLLSYWETRGERGHLLVFQ